jgi:hypothetical protein
MHADLVLCACAVLHSSSSCAAVGSHPMSKHCNLLVEQGGLRQCPGPSQPQDYKHERHKYGSHDGCTHGGVRGVKIGCP